MAILPIYSKKAKHTLKGRNWVSLRTGILGEMSEYVAKRVFNGDFPVYSYMYTLRKFIRINTISKNEIDEFVKLVAGKGLSIRDIELLANGFFKGSDNLRQQIKEGNIPWGLNQLKALSPRTTECTSAEQMMLRDLESVQRYMQKIICRASDDSFGNATFQVQASLLVQGIIDIMDNLKVTRNFSIAVRYLYDRCEQA